ncbi:MAG: DUF4139 domain-containing protein [Bacteroidota bacterium]
MNKHIFLLVLGLWTFLLPLQADERTVDADITNVQVYRERARITRIAKASVSSGENQLVFSGLSQNILPNSITVSGKGAGVIQSVSHRVAFLNEREAPAKIAALEDSLLAVQARLQVVKDDRFVLDSEQKLLLGNSSLGGTQDGFTAEDLAAMAKLYRDRLKEIRADLRTVSARERTHREREKALQAELRQFQSQRRQPTQEVLVAFKAPRSGSVEFTLEYMVSGASWQPFYDVRVSETNKPIQFMLKAQVYNSTGVNWDKVDLSLSTTNNALNNTKPTLNPWYLSFYNPRLQNRKYTSGPAAPVMSRRDAMSNTMEMDAGGLAFEDAEAEPMERATDYTTVSEGELGLEFAIALPYDIPADNKPHQVDIQAMDVEAEFLHVAVPKLERDVFLVADIKQDLLRGNANVYFQGTFVGETYINTDNPTDSLNLSLGRDPKVQVQRESIQDFTSKKVIGTNIRQTFGYRITVRNNKSTPVKLLVQDQMPVSQNNDIEVKLEKSGGASVNQTFGSLTWNLDLKPGETRTLEFSYEVKYPKNKAVSGL